MAKKFTLGLMINPLAGLGGSVALKGSDNLADEALSKGAIPQAENRMSQALYMLLPYKNNIKIYTASGHMGEKVCHELGFETHVIYSADNHHSNISFQSHFTEITSAKDTQLFLKQLIKKPVDIILFAGGDGTARDIYSVIGDSFPVLGVPAGVKIHSGVYAITPRGAGQIINKLLQGELISLMTADVMDIDEDAFRLGKVKSKFYGEMYVPAEPYYVQAVKMGGKEVDELVLADIAAEIIDTMEDEYFIMGSGSTVAAIMDELGLSNTLLGVDLIKNNAVIKQDLTSTELIELTKNKTTKIIITLIGGQGHIFGRGNQQLSPELIKQVGKENIIIVATKTKLNALNGRPLIVDSGDHKLDESLCGYYSIVTGYRDYVMYKADNFSGNGELND